jgi:hypothetical protein
VSPLAAFKYVWALPASAIGAIVAVSALLFGARVRARSGVLEVSLRARSARVTKMVNYMPFSAITFGHVVVALSEAEQDALRVHERAHVDQYELWGPLFLLAYPAESLIQLLLGRHPYRDNRFEVSARAAARRAGEAGTNEA